MEDKKAAPNPVEESAAKEAAPLDPTQITLNTVAQNVHLFEKAAQMQEDRYILRALRATSPIRSQLNERVLSLLLKKYLKKDLSKLHSLLSELVGPAPEEMEVDDKSSSQGPAEAEKITIEIELYIAFLVLLFLADQKRHQPVVNLSKAIVEKGASGHLHSLDHLFSRSFFYFGLASEALGQLEEIRSYLLTSLRTATLHRKEECQATLLNLLLRNYIHFNMLDQASKLISKATFPTTVGNNQFARYHYFMGKIKAIQLEYTESHEHLLQAIRKAPQLPKAAGFQQAVYKLAIIVQLLLGEIPERSTFRIPVLKKTLAPYLHITQAVRVGDLAAFHKAMQTHSEQFQKDKTYTLILRLRHNVIKTGIRMISLSYSRISLKDVCQKLHLETEEDAEFIIAKAIRDGVIDSSIDHAGSYMKSKEVLDIYSTNEPQAAFHQRITFCLELHNEAVKALRFPPNLHKKEIETPEERLEREQQEKELAKELEEDDDDDMF